MCNYRQVVNLIEIDISGYKKMYIFGDIEEQNNKNTESFDCVVIYYPLLIKRT
jgi:hypothetical protein